MRRPTGVQPAPGQEQQRPRPPSPVPGAGGGGQIGPAKPGTRPARQLPGVANRAAQPRTYQDAVGARVQIARALAAGARKRKQPPR